jgi:hypothetical protein
MSRRLRVPKELLKKLSLKRRSQLSAIAAIVGLAALATTQATGTATAGTDATKVEHLTLEGCQRASQPQACLWINSSNDFDLAKAADRRALVITEGNRPDLEDVTTYDQGKVHGMTEEFTDDVSVVWNFLPYDLCLIDTERFWDNNKKYGLADTVMVRHARNIFVIPQNGDFSGDLSKFDDQVDYYTTAWPGQCSTGDIVFRADTQAILDRY